MEDLQYGITLADRMSGPAQAAANSLGALAKRAHEAKGGLLEMSGGLLKTVEPVELLRHAFEGAEQGFNSFAAGISGGDAKGAVEGLTETLAGLAQLLDLVVPGLGQLASAAIKVGGAMTAMTVGILQSSAELALEQTGLRERLEETFEAMGDAPGAGKATLEMLNGLSDRLPQTRAQLVEWTKTYQSIGITDLGGIRHELEATASAQAIMGDKGAAAYEKLTKKVQLAIETHHGLKLAGNKLSELANTGANVSVVAARMGLSAEVLARDLKAGTVDAKAFGDALSGALIEKGAGPLAAMGSELSTQVAKAREKFGRLFDVGDAAKPFLAQMGNLLGIIDESQPSAQAAKFAITGLLKEGFSLVAKAVPIFKHFFLQLEIGGLRTYIALKPAIKTFRDFFATHSVGALLEHQVMKIAGAIENIAKVAASAINSVAKLLTLGEHVSKGLSEGLSSGMSAVSGAATGLAHAAISGIKDTLGIHSPSRVMLTLGAHAGVGLERGLQEREPSTTRAAAQIGGTVTAGAASAVAASPYASPTGGQRITIDVGGIHITGAPGQTALELTETAVALIFERMALMQGLG